MKYQSFYNYNIEHLIFAMSIFQESFRLNFATFFLKFPKCPCLKFIKKKKKKGKKKNGKHKIPNGLVSHDFVGEILFIFLREKKLAVFLVF